MEGEVIMFSENHKITARQVQCILVSSWIGKMCLLLPEFDDGTSVGNFLLCLFLGLAVTIVYALLLYHLGLRARYHFFDLIQEVMGTWMRRVIGVLYFLSLSIELIYMVRLFAKIVNEYLLFDHSLEALIVLIVLAGIYASGAGLEEQGRMSEVLYLLIVIPLAFMSIFAATEMTGETMSVSHDPFSLSIVKGSFLIFTSFGSISLIPFLVPPLKRKTGGRRRMTAGILIAGGGVVLLYLIGIGVFGEEGIAALPWPILTLMTNVTIPGGFLQRWDVVFLAVLLMSLFAGMGIGMFAVRTMAENLMECGPKRWVCGACGAIVLAGAFLCGTYEAAMRLSIVVNGCFLTPLLAVFMVVLAVLSSKKKVRVEQCEK
ncbi:MAG: GerAB/ArcD/ProY family transporter [Robinsoniella sp.]|nr:GerAB/ArcD/ProY family transporter [Robinsoniella sp.]